MIRWLRKNLSSECISPKSRKRIITYLKRKSLSSCVRIASKWTSSEWPTIEALEKRAKFEKEELKAFRYAESKTDLGTLEIGEYGKE